MALLLPQCTGLSESLHQLAVLRRRVSVQGRHHGPRRSVRGKHGATERSTRTRVASNDHIRIVGTEPCCKISSIVMAPRKPARRSSRLRAKKGREAVKSETTDDVDAADWASRVPVNNGLVELDPVTMAEIRAGKVDRIASLTSTSEVRDYFPPRGSGFPRVPGVPFEVLVAAASAIALATVAAILNTLSNQRVGEKASRSDLEEKKFSTDGVPAGGAIVTPFDLRRPSSRTGLDYPNMPSPPSLSKNGLPPQKQQGQHQGSEMSRNGTSLENVTPFFADEQGREAKNGPSLEGVTPFFPDEQGREAKNGPSLEGVKPFFPDEQVKNALSLEGVTPFFADEQGREAKNGPSLEGVTPFFPDEQGREAKNGPSLEAVTPFFADELGRSASGASQSKGSSKGVEPLFPDERDGKPGITGKPSSSGFWGWKSKEAKKDTMVAKPPVDFSDKKSVEDELAPQVLASGPIQTEGKQMLAGMASQPQDQHREFMEATAEDGLSPSFEGGEAPSVARDLSPEEVAVLEEIKQEEAKQHAKFQALQAAFPALAIGAGAVGALVGVDGAFQMVGITATASFISYELMWANKRQELLDEISRITDHHKLFNFLQKRKIVKDDC